MSREALRMALEALELSAVTVDSFGVQKKTNEAITAIKEALAQTQERITSKRIAPYSTTLSSLLNSPAHQNAMAQPEQEPVAIRYDYDGHGWTYIDNGHGSNWRERVTHLDAENLYTTPPQSTWIGLTDEEVVNLKMLGRDLEFVSMTALRRFAQAIEQALKEKNNAA